MARGMHGGGGGRCGGGGACMGGETTSAADGTHPTGMQSCLKYKLWKIFFSNLNTLVVCYASLTYL